MDPSSTTPPEPASSRDAAVESVLPSRLLPRVSFRAMMSLTAVSAVVIAIVNAADQGGIYARAASMGFLFVLATACILAVLFLTSWSISYIPRVIGAALIACSVMLFLVQIAGSAESVIGIFARPIWVLNFLIIGWCLILMPIGVDRDDTELSPFASDQLPPQIMAPREPKL